MRTRTLVMTLLFATIGSLLGVVLVERPAAAAGFKVNVIGSPFNPDGDGVRDKVRIAVESPGSVTVDLRIVDFNGRKVRTLASGGAVDGRREWTWNGRASDGSKVPYGPYKVKATFHTGTRDVKRSAWLTRARYVPYPKRPGAVVVAIDPGHGGPASGAVWRGLKEDTVNLDISKRLEAMLKGAGIGVVLTRRTDRNVSPVGLDLNGDGKYERLDELIARNDVANLARADIHIALHNNASSCHCIRGTEMYTHNGRGWSPEGIKLAGYLLSSHLWHLDRQPGYTPRNRGVKFHAFKALKPYHAVKMPRPSLQPSVLGESIFIDRPSEHRILSKRSGRTAIAAAYFDGIARYLAWRPFGLHYEVLDAPTSVVAGGKASVTVRLTNTGQRTSSGWKLVARVVAVLPRYDGRPAKGDIVASTKVPDGLKPSQSVEIELSGIPMRDKAGKWLLKLDVSLPNGRMSKHGVVGPQLRVNTRNP